jgi:hypothetical protein
VGWTRRIWVTSMALATAIVVTVSLASLRMRPKDVSTADVPSWFPVVVVQEVGGARRCRIAFWKDLAEPPAGLAYVVPETDREACLRDLAAQERSATWTDRPGLELHVVAADLSSVSESGGQDVTLVASWDDDWVNRGWYTAYPDRIEPRRYQGYGPGAILVPLTWAFLAACAAGALAARALRAKL